MNNLEKNLSESFRRVRSDIVKLQEQVLQLARTQASLAEKLDDTGSRMAVRVIKTVKSPIVKSRAKHFVASKTGKKFHISECPYTRNIKPKSMIKFKSKNTALNQGYKPCDCVK